MGPSAIAVSICVKSDLISSINMNTFPPPTACLEANSAHLNAFIQRLVEPRECTRLQIVEINSITARVRVKSLASQVRLRVFECPCQIHVLSDPQKQRPRIGG